jgi:hypothetical protein
MIPAIAPTPAPSPGVTGAGALFIYMKDASSPPKIAHMQQQVLTIGITDNMPAMRPPTSAGFILFVIRFETLS